MANDLNKTRIDHLFSADIDLECWGFYPSVGGGVRVNSVPKSGEVFTQTEIIGEVVPGGEVTQLLRYNGVFDLDGRITLKLNDGTLVYVPYTGKADFCTVDEIKEFAAGNIEKGVDVYFASPIESTDPKLDKMFVFAVGKLDNAKKPGKLMLDLYEYECLPL